MPWLQLKAHVAPEQADLLEELLLEEGATAIGLQDAHDDPVFEPERGTTPLWQDTILTGLYDDLDGINEGRPRKRCTTVLGFSTEEIVARDRLAVPMSAHPVESVNLKDPRLGLFQQCQEMIDRYGVTKGRIHLTLSPGERQAGLTVNEYETLLMRHDLAEVLRDPFRFMAEKSRHLLADPRAIPNKTIGYAKYDLVRIFNELVDALGLNDSMIEQVASRFFGAPASRFLRMKRSVNVLVTNGNSAQRGHLAQGRFQSPILVQWRQAKNRMRHIDITLVRFK